MLKKVKIALSLFMLSLIVSSTILPSIVSANEVNKMQEEQVFDETLSEIDIKLSRPIQLSSEEWTKSVERGKDLGLTEERMRELADLAFSPYQARGSVWDGQGVTVSEFAWVIENILAGLVSGGVGALGKLAAKKGLAVARATLTRAIRAAAIRLGVLTNRFVAIMERVLDSIDIFKNAGMAFSRWYDSIDAVPNNGRINFF